MKTLIYIIALIAINTLAISQESLQSDPEINRIYTEVDSEAQFPGGILNLYEEYIMPNLNLPQEAAANKIEGRVFVAFVIEKDGSISNVEVVKGVGYGCDQEALRLVKNMPKWDAAILNGNKVRQKMILPFLFKSKLGE